LALAFATASSGQQATGTASSDQGSLDELIVTATRKSEPLNRVPISISAYSQETMDAQGVRDITDLSRLTPGLSLTPLGSEDIAGNNTTISIRGIASNIGTATTGIYIDDTPIQVRALGNETSNVYPKVFDLERVEVLKGPQGTLFGAGAEGGTVRFISAQPSLDTTSGYTRAELAYTEDGAPSYEAGSAFGAPIIDNKLAFRVSAWFRQDGGYIDRVDEQTGALQQSNANSQDSYVVKGAMKWEIAPAFDATFSVYRQRIDTANPSIFFANLSDPGDGVFRSGRVIPTTENDVFTLPSLNLQYDADFLSVISTTSYFSRNVDRQVDYSNFVGAVVLEGPFSYGPGQYSAAYINDDQRNFTQEIRVQSRGDGPWSWVVGGFFSRAKQQTYQFKDSSSLPERESRRWTRTTIARRAAL
jgi:outer membrane receptor protein involved in Fe transport